MSALAADAEDDAEDNEDIFDPGLFLNEDYGEHAYDLGDGARQTCLCLEGASTDHDLTGQVVWPVSVALARFVAARLDSLKGRRVVEVGAGTALAGLAAARSAAASVVLTDGSDVIVKLLERALASSNVTATLKAPISVRKLLWGDRASFDGISSCDVVLGADVVCWPRLVEPLLQTVRALLRGSADGVFYCGFVSRSQLTERLFFEKSGRFGFSIKEHALASFLPDPVPEECRSNMELRVLELRLKNDARGAPDVFASDDPANAEATGDIAC